MASLNKVMLIGNVGRDPEVRDFEGGVRKANFTLATTERFRDREQTEWHRIVVWRQLADLAEKYIRKGSQIYVEGRISTRTYKDRDGADRSITEIEASAIQLLGRRGDSSEVGAPASYEPRQRPASAPAAPASAPAPASVAPAAGGEDIDDLPF